MDRSKSPTQRSRKLCRAIGAVLVCLIAAWSGQGQDAQGILKLSIVDESTGQTIPARVEVLDKDGKAYLAEDGLLIGGD
jgi:hypothetical protein